MNCAAVVLYIASAVAPDDSGESENHCDDVDAIADADADAVADVDAGFNDADRRLCGGGGGGGEDWDSTSAP